MPQSRRADRATQVIDRTSVHSEAGVQKEEGMRRRILRGLVMISLLTIVGRDAHAAAYGVDLIPFAGYRWGGDMSTISGVKKFDVGDNYNVGGAIDFNVSPTAAAELYYSYFKSNWDATLV